MFRIADGREHFYQWDIDRQIIVEDSSITEVHFCNRTDDCSLVVEVVDGLANVPNVILQKSFDIRVFGYDGKATRYDEAFKVKARTKPTDYVYTEVEIKRYEDLEKHIDERLDEIAESGITVDLTGYATEKYVDNAIYNSVYTYFVDMQDTPQGLENAIPATAEMIEFAERWRENKSVCLYIRDYEATNTGSWFPVSIGGSEYQIMMTRASVEETSYKNGYPTRYYSYRLLHYPDGWVQYKEFIGSFTITTKEYVDKAIANIEIPEGGDVDLTDYYTKTEVDTELAKKVSMPTESGFELPNTSNDTVLVFKKGQTVPRTTPISNSGSSMTEGGYIAQYDANGRLSSGNPTSFYHVANKLYVDNAIAKIDNSNYYTKDEVNALFEGIATAEGGSY